MATEEQVKFYDNFLEHFESQVNNARNVGFRQLTRHAIREFGNNVESVFEIGCAYGYNSEYLTREFPGTKVHGVDLSPNSIEEAKKRYPHGRWECTDITEWEPEDDKKDLILMSDVLEHIPLANHAQLYKVLGWVSAPQALLVLSFPVPEAPNDTPQPVEEKILLNTVLRHLFEIGFDIVHYVDRPFPYQRLIVQKG